METETSIIKNSEKIGKVLQKLLEPNFKIKNNVYLNLFLTHLAGKRDDEKTSQNGENDNLQDQFCQWIIDASILWDKQKVKPKPTILAFALNFASQLSADEQVFVKLNCQNVYESLVDVAQANSRSQPIVTLGLVTLFCSFLEHKSGLQWVVATTHWTDTIELGLKAHAICIRHKACHFVQKLLEKTISFNRNFGINLVKILIKPLKHVLRSLLSSNKTELTQVESKKIYGYLKPTLNFILAVIEPLLKNFNKPVLQLFIQQEVPEIIDKYLLLSQYEDLSFKLLQIQFVFLFHKMHEKVIGEEEVDNDSLKLFDCKVMFNLIKNEMNKDYVRCVIKTCDYAHDLFCCLAPRMPRFTKKGSILEFQIQVIFIQITPLYALSGQFITDKSAASLYFDDYFRNRFCQKWFEMGGNENIEMCYKWIRQLIPKPDLVDDVILCCQYITKMKKLLNKERASFIFPVLVYSLTDALISLKNGRCVDLSNSCMMYFMTIVETIIDLVESFDLTWNDTIETLCVMDCAYDFLQYSNWNDNLLTVKGLKLLRTAISKYMSPDMVLLIYNNKKSKISEVGNLLYNKCQDNSCEIRDSALEVVLQLCVNANTKFPAFINALLDAKLPRLVVDIAFKDNEYYVRATAFKCLQELIQIPEIWEDILDMDNKFFDKLLDVFEHENEGIVRKEVTALIFKIDKYQSFPEHAVLRLYDVMTQAAIADLYWEVKYNALDYWFNKWEDNLSDQGMIDRAFPSHTFSKELKKIVALNEIEIRKRVVKVLNQLAQIGCLYVIKCAVKDDCDFEVSKKATDFASDMLKLFKMYKIHCDNVDQSPLQVPTVQVKKSPTIELDSIQKQSRSEPATSVSVDCASDLHSIADTENLEYPRFSNSPFFDPVSPPPYSPLSGQNIVTRSKSTSQSTSQSSVSQSTGNSSPQQYENSVYQQSSSSSSTQPCTYNGNTQQQPASSMELCLPDNDVYQQTQSTSTTQLYTLDSNVYQQAQPISPMQFCTPDNNAYHQTSPIPMQCTTSFDNIFQGACQTLSTSPVSNVYQASPTSAAQSQSLDSNSPANKNIPIANLDHGIDFFNCDGVNYDHVQLENVVESNGLIQQKPLQDEFLNPNNMMQHNPIDQFQIASSSVQMKTKTYLAPSEFLNFVYQEVETYTMEKTQWVNNLDVFDSLLDDILKEYDTADVNRMDTIVY